MLSVSDFRSGRNALRKKQAEHRSHLYQEVLPYLSTALLYLIITLVIYNNSSQLAVDVYLFLTCMSFVISILVGRFKKKWLVHVVNLMLASIIFIGANALIISGDFIQNQSGKSHVQSLELYETLIWAEHKDPIKPLLNSTGTDIKEVGEAADDTLNWNPIIWVFIEAAVLFALNLFLYIAIISIRRQHYGGFIEYIDRVKSWTAEFLEIFSD
jgi:hypothetical protein